MNYLAHGHRWLDDPYFVAGTALPDWLNVVNRRVRCRSRHAETQRHHRDARIAALARGVIQHHHDDGWFHQTAPFAELSLRFSKRLRERLPSQDRHRPAFVGHILVELLLDSALAERDRTLLDRYYAAVDRVDPQLVARGLAEMTGTELPSLNEWIPRFSRERFLYDYLQDAKLQFRINQVLLRVGLDWLPDDTLDCLADARSDVTTRLDEWLRDWPSPCAQEPPTQNKRTASCNLE